MRNNNQKVIKRISVGSMKQNRMRNLFAAAAICLTTLLFTAVFSMGFGMVQLFQEQTMKEVGSRFHAGLKRVTLEQYEKITDNPRVVSSSYNIFLGIVENLKQRQGELRYADSEEELRESFIDIKEGGIPQEKDDILMDTICLKELKVPLQVGAKVPITFTFMGEKIEKEFTLCGWYEGSQISHSSQIYISREYWEAVKGNYTEDDFLEHYRESGDMEGLLSGNLFFQNAKNIEENVKAVIEEAGYVPESGTETPEELESGKVIEYGVNWAYLTSRMEGIDLETAVLLGAAFLVILVTGYLIIFNIFQLSILRDIRFYGLLKTIGTTKKQIKKLVYRQVWRLCLAGIPVGLVLGYFTGQLLLPFLLQMTSADGEETGLWFSPWIFLFGAVFSIVTVGISCRKPAKIAGNVSPIEAVRYSEGTIKRKRVKKSQKGAQIRRMAFSNLGRNKKKTTVVILSISLSIILLELVATGVGSFRMEQYLEERMTGDYMLSNANWSRASTSTIDFSIDEAYLAGADSMEGVIESSELWNVTSWHTLSEKGRKAYQKLYEQGKLMTGYAATAAEQIQQVIEGKTRISNTIFGYSEALFKNLKPVKGTIDLEKFRTGDYVILQETLWNERGETGDSIYEPGDKITVELPGKNAAQEPVFNEEGEVVDYQLTGLEEREMEVMAVVESLPNSMDLHMYTPNGITMILPPELLKACPNAVLFAKSYEVEEEAMERFAQYVENYCENVNPNMGFLSKESLAQEFSGMVQGISVVGYSLCAVIALIGILNFANSMMTGIIARKQELAVMQSIGMTQGQIRKMLLWESGYYLLISAVVSILIGSLGAYWIVGALNEVISCFAYRYTAVPFLILIPVFALLSSAIALAAYHQTQKKSVVERLREAE